MGGVLGIGNATLDIIHEVDRYPRENEEIRARSCRQRLGGNTANTLVVLSQLGLACGWAGTLVADEFGRQIADLLARHAIDIGAAEWLQTGSVPVSSVILSRDGGSRTITHYRDLAEYTAASFEAIDLKPYDWLHFEGRNVAAVRQMLNYVQWQTPACRCSLEVEKPREDIESLFPLVDVLLFSKSYAHSQGYTEPMALLNAVHSGCPDTDLFCAWGEEGAFGLDHAGNEHRQAAVIPDCVVDTLGAGDTFNAGIRGGRLQGLDTGAQLAAACQLAGRKCGQDGLDNLFR